MLSVVVLLGYTGQLSLAQFALAGIASLFAARLVGERGWPLELSFLVAVGVTIPIGLLFADPGAAHARHQSRGRHARARDGRERDDLHEHEVGRRIRFHPGSWRSTLFGISIDPITHATRYGIVAFVVLALLVLCALAVASIRRGVVGRRLIAVRTNERAAAALGISVFGVKLYAFGLAAAIAGVGGVVLTFRTTTVAYSRLHPARVHPGRCLHGDRRHRLRPRCALRVAARPGRLRHLAARRVSLVRLADPRRPSHGRRGLPRPTVFSPR